QAFLTVRLIALERAVGTRDRRRGARSFARAVHGCEVARVLRGAAQHGLLVKGVGRVGERARPIAAGLGDVRVWVEHDLRASARGPADGLRIPPAFVANRDAEGQRSGGEDMPFPSERGIDVVLSRVDLPLVLPSGD